MFNEHLGNLKRFGVVEQVDRKFWRICMSHRLCHAGPTWQATGNTEEGMRTSVLFAVWSGELILLLASHF